MRRGAYLMLAMAIAIGIQARRTQTQGMNAKPIAPLAWLVGGVWTADASKLGGGMQRAEMRYEWSDNDEYIRFTMHFVSGEKTSYIYDGSFFWDPEKATLAMWNMNGKNEIMQGPVKIDENSLRVIFRAKNAQEKEADFRMSIVRKSNDRYEWETEEKQPQGWKELLSLDYLRKPESKKQGP